MTATATTTGTSEPAAVADLLRRDPNGLSTGWLAASWTRADEFFRALMVLADSRAGALKSAFDERYDLYHDAVVRHLGNDRAALRFIHRQRGWQALTYDELHNRCTLLARVWVDRGVEPGVVVATFLPVGVDYLVALFTGWKLGACVCPVPVYGRDFSIARRLTDAGPAFVATSVDYHSVLDDFADTLLPVTAEASASAGMSGHTRSHTFAAGEVCALLYSPLREEHGVPVELTCDDAYLRGLRDGLLSYNLRPGEALAAPGFPALQYQPAVITAVLLAGATYVDIGVPIVRAEPQRLVDLPLGMLGLSVEVRDILLKHQPARPPTWRQWFRSPEEVTDWTAWQDFIDAYSLAKNPASNVIVEAAAGGALLCDHEQTGDGRMRRLMNIHPAAGVPWTMQDSTDTGQEAVGNYGVVVHGAEEPVVSHVILTRYRDQDGIYLGNPTPRRNGWVYPSAEVVAAITDLSYVHAASVIEVPSGDDYHYRFVLLVFTGYHGVIAPELDNARKQRIEQAIFDRVGELFIPDRIRLLPLFARLVDGVADDQWCRLQYHLGSLYRKARSPVFAALTRLRQSVREDAASRSTE